MALAKDWGLPDLTRSPVSPSATISVSGAILLVITGFPAAIASMTTWPKPSELLAKAKTSRALRNETTSVWKPTNRTFSPNPNRSINRRRVTPYPQGSWPAISKRALGTRMHNSGIAWIKRSWPFRGSRRPIEPTTALSLSPHCSRRFTLGSENFSGSIP